jgi:signal transduction histidine kinase
MDETILLVDDEEGIRKVLKISLADAGYRVFTAASAEEALRLYDEEAPPIVLTDIKMPGMSGIDLLKAIKIRNPETEVIMITGHGDMDLAILSLKHQATDFITKPIDDEMLDVALSRAREKIGLRRQVREYTTNLERLVQIQSERLVQAERQAAAGQVMESFVAALRDLGQEQPGGIRFFNDMPCFVAIHNRDRKIVAVNQLFRDRLGDRVEDDSWSVYVGESNDPQNCPVARTLATGLGQRSRETVRCINGNNLPVVVHTAPIKTGGNDVALVLEISADLVELRRLQDELRITQHKYEQLFNEVPSYISVQDHEFQVLAANRRFKEEFGEPGGSLCHRVFRHRDDPCPGCPAALTFEDGRTHEAEMSVTAMDGRNLTVLVHTAPIRDVGGRIVEVIEVSTDITPIRELQDHLTSLGLLIGSISHGVKGILTGLDGGLYRIESGLKKENVTEIREGWETVNLLIGRIRNMVLDILYYAKERELAWERVDAIRLATEVAQVVEPKMVRANVAFARDFDPAAGEFEVDAGVVRSALVSILENAVDACLMDAAKTDHQVTFRVRSQGLDMVFEIEDNGVGMDQATREHLFTLFYSSKGDRGTGLGLYISNKVVRQHGGSIRVESTLGQGSRFIVQIPKIPPGDDQGGA